MKEFVQALPWFFSGLLDQLHTANAGLLAIRF